MAICHQFVYFSQRVHKYDLRQIETGAKHSVQRNRIKQRDS